MNRRITPSEAVGAEAGAPDEPAGAPDEPAEGPAATTAAEDAELSRLDNRALATVGIAVLLIWAVPQAFGLMMAPATDVASPFLVAYTVAIGAALVCAAGAAVIGWQTLRIRPLAADDTEDRRAHARDAVDDKRAGTAQAVGFLATGVVLSVAAHAVVFALSVVPPGRF